MGQRPAVRTVRFGNRRIVMHFKEQTWTHQHTHQSTINTRNHHTCTLIHTFDTHGHSSTRYGGHVLAQTTYVNHSRRSTNIVESTTNTHLFCHPNHLVVALNVCSLVPPVRPIIVLWFNIIVVVLLLPLSPSLLFLSLINSLLSLPPNCGNRQPNQCNLWDTSTSIQTYQRQQATKQRIHCSLPNDWPRSHRNTFGLPDSRTYYGWCVNADSECERKK